MSSIQTVKSVRTGLAVGMAVALCSVGCNGDPVERSRPARGDLMAEGRSRATESQPEPPSVPPGPWLTVDPAENRSLEEMRIYHQGPQQAPVILHRRTVLVPLDPNEIPSAQLLVQAVITPNGRVARARILREPTLPGLERQVLHRRMAETLLAFSFEPAKLDGWPVAVYYNLSLEIEGEV